MSTQPRHQTSIKTPNIKHKHITMGSEPSWQIRKAVELYIHQKGCYLRPKPPKTRKGRIYTQTSLTIHCDSPNPRMLRPYTKWLNGAVLAHDQHTSSCVLYVLVSINCTKESHCDTSIHACNVLWSYSPPLLLSITSLLPPAFPLPHSNSCISFSYPRPQTSLYIWEKALYLSLWTGLFHLTW
jgi:hypothetical protein